MYMGNEETLMILLNALGIDLSDPQSDFFSNGFLPPGSQISFDLIKHYYLIDANIADKFDF